MSRRARILWIAGGGVAVAILVAAVSAVLILRSDWFREKVRARIVTVVERATGGRAEVGAFRFDWKQMRAEVDGFVLHGSEPPDGPPLFRAGAIVLGIKVSLGAEAGRRSAISGCAASADLRRLFIRTDIPTCLRRKCGGQARAPSRPFWIWPSAASAWRMAASKSRAKGKTPFDAQGRDLKGAVRL